MGAIGVDGQIEKEINLSIALKLDTMLRAYGFQTIMTRDSDVSIHSPDAKTVRQQKTSDLKNRLKLLEDTSSGILISIHQNKYSQSSAHGTQVFYGKNCLESKELAEMLQKTITGYLQPENTREIKQATKDIYILYQATKPAVMVECGFLSNAAEADKLTDEDIPGSNCIFDLYGVNELLGRSIVKDGRWDGKSSKDNLCMFAMWVRISQMVWPLP